MQLKWQQESNPKQIYSSWPMAWPIGFRVALESVLLDHELNICSDSFSVSVSAACDNKPLVIKHDGSSSVSISFKHFLPQYDPPPIEWPDPLDIHCVNAVIA